MGWVETKGEGSAAGLEVLREGLVLAAGPVVQASVEILDGEGLGKVRAWSASSNENSRRSNAGPHLIDGCLTKTGLTIEP